MGSVNFIAAYMGDGLSLALLCVTYISIRWMRKEKTEENKFLEALILTTMVTSVADALSFWVDGRPEHIYYVLNYATNTWVYFSNMLIGLIFWRVVVLHTGIRVSRLHAGVIYVCSALPIPVLIVNLFYPIAFNIDENNVYSREPLFILCLGLEILFAFDGILIYFLAEKEGKTTREFPVWQFVVPTLIGFMTQFFFYGVATIVPCLSISIYNMILGMQQDRMVRDPLTGAYNRFYLDTVKLKVKKKNAKYLVMMLDLNSFKGINDEFGHAEGDVALKTVADVLLKAVGKRGLVVRYAGDEFLIFVKGNEEGTAATIRENIREGLAEANAASGKDYQLSLAIGDTVFDPAVDTFDDVMKRVDGLMYEEKRVFHREYNRRH